MEEEIDWNKCVLCQKESPEKLRCPFDSKQTGAETWYDSLCLSIQKFCEAGCFPFETRQEYALEKEVLAQLFREKQAKWHKLCRNEFSNEKLERALKRKANESNDPNDSCRKKLPRKSTGAEDCLSCFFCEETSGELHKASTFKLDSNVRECAGILNDAILVGKLSAGDMVALDAMYHTQCLSKLYNDAARMKNQASNMQTDEDSVCRGMALAELVSFLEQSRNDLDESSVFKLSELSKMYALRLEQMGVDISGRINTTRLKERLLQQCPELSSYKDGREVIIAFSEDVASVLKSAAEKNSDREAMVISQAANIIRRDLLDMEKSQFGGTFKNECQENSVPQSLRSLIKMIMGGASIKTQSSNIVENQAALSVSQLIRFNSVVKRRKDSQTSYHAKDRETPLPTYIGLLLHAETRKKGLIDKMCDLGLSISYNRVLEISTEVGNKVAAQFEAEKVVCPSNLRLDLFTTSAVDNIDHNPTSTTATGSLHGTAISLFQHPTKENCGQVREAIQPPPDQHNDRIIPLPKQYADVPPVQPWKTEPSFPAGTTVKTEDIIKLSANLSDEEKWLEHVKNVIGINVDEIQEVTISWPAFHASRAVATTDIPSDISCLLPLFQEEAKSVAMILHAMNTVKCSTEFLNHGQIPVITCDQPLYAIAKKIQWRWPETYGEKKYVTILGGLHIEIAAWRALGDLLEGSGWTSAITQANVASTGTADSFLKASHVSRTRHAHQVTASTLHILMCRAYDSYLEGQSLNENKLEFQEWKRHRSSSCPQFKYWSLILKIELTVLLFVRSLRDGRFSIYKESIRELLPCFFALDKINYARWLSVHLHDMIRLGETCNGVHQKFEEGCFVVRKTQRKFSALAIDHAHEQNNKLVKGDGGAVGLTESSSQLLRWMVSGPEIARIISQFESVQDLIKTKQSKGPDIHHHEQTKSIQEKFRTQVKALSEVMETFGNPFEEVTDDLLVLDTKEIASENVVATIRCIDKEGEAQFQSFVEERFVKKEKEVTDVIKLNKFALFSNPRKSPSKDKQAIASLKQNCSLFSRLYISCQVRHGNLDEFFSHENQSYPPSISKYGDLRPCAKSELLKCLESLPATPYTNTPPVVGAILIDGAALVNMLKPNGACKTFSDYAYQVYLPYITQQLQRVQRIDVIWDRYIQNSLKAHTRGNRGTGVRRRVEPDVRLPGNWGEFLKVDSNKTELFLYLAKLTTTVHCEDNKRIVSTSDTMVLSSSDGVTADISPCTHEEADTRLLLHASDCAKNDINKVMIRTVDTDVVVLAIVYFSQLAVNEMWIAFGVGKQFRYIPIHDIVHALGDDKSRVLHVFHAFTGCDQTSGFLGRGKITAWSTWMSYGEVTAAFSLLRQRPTVQDVLNAMPVLERFVVIMYDRTNQSQNVNDARKVLFSQKERSLENIPPTADALLQHTKRVAYQAGHCWGQCMLSCPELPAPSECGWTKSKTDLWQPEWTTLPEASKVCQELLKCGCKAEKGCSGRCKCLKAGMPCTALCKCGGECERDI